MPPNPATDTGGTPANAADGGPDAATSPPDQQNKNQQQDVEPDLDSHPKIQNHVTFATKITPTAVTYSGAVSHSLPKNREERARAIQDRLRAMAFEKNWMEQHNGVPVLFSHHPDDFVIGIPFDDKKTDILEVAEAIEEVYPSPIATAAYYSSKCAYVSFPTAEARDKALSMPLTLRNDQIPVFPVVRSTGSRITINAEYIPIGDLQVRHALLQELYKEYGKIIHFSSLCNIKSKLNRAATRFVLEVRPDASEDMMIPRVAPVKGCNVLFAWSGSNFCYRCGKGDHLKAQCPKPHDYVLHEQAALSEPILGRAFPDPDAPLRPLKSNGKQVPVPVAQVTGKNGKQGSGNAPTLPGKRKLSGHPSNAPSGTVSASDSDSGEKPAHKKGPGRPPKESNIVRPTIPTRRENKISVADVTASSAPLLIGQQLAGATSVPRTEAPPLKSPVDATGANDGLATETAPPSTLATEEKLTGSAGIGSGEKLTAGNPLNAPSEPVRVSDSVLGGPPTHSEAPGTPPKESKLVHENDPNGRENHNCVADVTVSSASPPLGQHSAGASASGANTAEAGVPPSKSSADAVGASDGLACSTTFPPTVAMEEKVPGSTTTTTAQNPDEDSLMDGDDPSDHEEEDGDTSCDMEGIELTLQERLEMDDPNTSAERVKELRIKQQRWKEKPPPGKKGQRAATKNVKVDNILDGKASTVARTTRPRKNK